MRQPHGGGRLCCTRSCRALLLHAITEWLKYSNLIRAEIDAEIEALITATHQLEESACGAPQLDRTMATVRRT
jgi:hypothetical protein